MAKLTLDFSEANDIEPIPEGVYAAEVDKVELRQPNPADPGGLNFQFTITEGEHAGRKVWLYRSLKPKAMPWTLETFDAFGINLRETGIEIDDKTKIVVVPNLNGQQCYVSLTIEDYVQNEGKPNEKTTQQNRVDAVMASE